MVGKMLFTYHDYDSIRESHVEGKAESPALEPRFG